jgi:hypothetical protein
MKSLIPNKNPAAAIFKSAAALALVAGNLHAAEPTKSALLNEKIVKATEIYATAHPELARFISDTEGLNYKPIMDPSTASLLGIKFTGETNSVVLNEKVVDALQMYAAKYPESAVFITDTVTGVTTKGLIDPSSGKSIGMRFVEEEPAR